MNLRLAHKLITAAENQPSGFLRVRGREETQEVHWMAEAGLIQATEPGELEPSEAVITRITHAGHHFYRAFNQLRSFANN